MMRNNKVISIIIPTYDEEKVVVNCLRSLNNQSYKDIEIIIVDDGSTDNTLNQISKIKYQKSNIKLLRQKHFGPGSARNLGAKHANGEILVFVDADMTFAKNFIKDLTKPILNGETIGTFSKNEMNANKDNVWSICWNINRNWPIDKLIPPNYPNKAPVFRAILKKEFDKVGGFDATGEYTDDWSLSRKLKVMSTVAPGAVYYHFNPSNLNEVYSQARWIGKNEFISGNVLRRIRSIIQYSPPISLVSGVAKSILNFNLLVQRSFSEVGYFLIFKFVYDAGVFISVIRSFLNEKKAK